MPVDAVTSAEAARILGVSNATVSRACTAHDIGTLLNPRIRVLSPEDVERLRGLVSNKRGNPQFGTAGMAQKGVKARAKARKAAAKQKPSGKKPSG